MADCTKQVCGECIPLFRYFVNQQAVLENEEASVTIPCPTGYHCDVPEITVEFEEGTKKIRPDIDPNDPDNDPICSYDCEVNNIIPPENPTTLLNPTRRVKNAEQTATCADLGYSEGTGTVTIPEATIIRTLQPSDIQSIVQEQVNLEAFNLAKLTLQIRVTLGLAQCGSEPDTPCDLTEPSNENYGQYSVPTTQGAFGCTNLQEVTQDPGIFRLSYVSGARQDSENPCPNCYPPFCVPAEYIWKFDGTYGLQANDGFSSIPYTGALYCDQDLGVVETAMLAEPTVALTNDRRGRKVEVEGPCLPLTATDLVSNVIMQVHRIERWIVEPPQSVSIVGWASIKDQIFPSPGATPTGSDDYDGTFPNENTTFGQPWFRAFNGGAINFRGFALDSIWTTCYFATNAQPTVSGCAWLLALSDDNGAMWVGLKVTGLTPIGEYNFRPDANGWTVEQQKADCRLMTSTQLPNYTFLANVLTASANGALPNIDGVAPQVADRILVTGESNQQYNGIYVVTDLGSAGTPWILTRATDADSDPEVTPGIWTQITEGLTFSGIYMQLTTWPSVTLNTTNLTFAQVLNSITIQ